MHRTLVTEADEWPLDLVAAKEHLRVDDEITESDSVIESLIRAATRTAEAFLNRALISQQWTQYLDMFPGETGAITVPLGRVISVDSLVYYDSNAVETTMPTSEYQAEITRDSRNRVVPAPDCTWPCTEAGRINSVALTFTAGYGASREDVPEDIIAGIKLILGHLYENRETVLVGVNAAELPLGAESILGYHRIEMV